MMFYTSLHIISIISWRQLHIFVPIFTYSLVHGYDCEAPCPKTRDQKTSRLLLHDDEDDATDESDNI